MSEVMGSYCDKELPPTNEEDAENLLSEKKQKEMDGFLRHIDDSRRPIIGDQKGVKISRKNLQLKVIKKIFWRDPSERRNGETTKTIYIISKKNGPCVEIEADSIEEAIRAYLSQDLENQKSISEK